MENWVVLQVNENQKTIVYVFNNVFLNLNVIKEGLRDFLR